MPSTPAAITSPSGFRKFWIGVATGIAQIVSLGLVEGDRALWLTVVLAVLGAYGIHRVPNADTDPEVTP